MALGEAQQCTSLAVLSQCVDKVLERAVPHVSQRSLHQSLLQQQVHQRQLVVLEAQLAQALQNARDPQIVVLRPVCEKQEPFG